MVKNYLIFILLAVTTAELVHVTIDSTMQLSWDYNNASDTSATFTITVVSR
jgi:hypothetical protein